MYARRATPSPVLKRATDFACELRRELGIVPLAGTARGVTFAERHRQLVREYWKPARYYTEFRVYRDRGSGNIDSEDLPRSFYDTVRRQMGNIGTRASEICFRPHSRVGVIGSRGSGIGFVLRCISRKTGHGAFAGLISRVPKRAFKILSEFQTSKGRRTILFFENFCSSKDRAPRKRTGVYSFAPSSFFFPSSLSFSSGLSHGDENAGKNRL